MIGIRQGASRKQAKTMHSRLCNLEMLKSHIALVSAEERSELLDLTYEQVKQRSTPQWYSARKAEMKQALNTAWTDGTKTRLKQFKIDSAAMDKFLT